MTQFSSDALNDVLPHLRRYATSLTRNPADAEDLLQDCVERAITRMEQFEVGSDLRRWMFTIMRNLHIDGCRKAQRRGIHVEIEEWHDGSSAPADQQDVIHVKDVANAIDDLPEEDRELLMAASLQGAKYQDIADEHGLALGTVKSRLSRIRTKLRQDTDAA